MNQISRSYTTSPMINKPLYLWGFSPMQLMLFCLTLLLTIILGQLVNRIILVAGVIVYGALGTIIFPRIAKENKFGNPNYLQSLFLSINTASKRKFTDKNTIIKYLVTEKRDGTK